VAGGAGPAARLVEQLFAVLAEEGGEGVLGLLHEDFVMRVGPDVSAEPDVYVGEEGARRYLDGFAGALDNVSFELLGLEEHGDTVLVAIVMSARGGHTGIEVSQRGAGVVRVRDGRVLSIDSQRDLEAARRALAGESAAPPGSA
jgi:ketosteroid isomerase-like protein